VRGRVRWTLFAGWGLLVTASFAGAQTPPGVAPTPPGVAPQAAPGPPGAPGGVPEADGLVQLDFNDVELSVVIDTIARLTGTNFIYDDRVRGRVTIVSPTKIPVDQAFAVFESVLQVKGFTTVEGPGGSVKIIPLRDAKESAIGTEPGPTPTPNRDAFVTRLIPLKYIDADNITNSLKPLVSKDAAMMAYAPTNTVILTDAASNIRRILEILAAIDVETYKEELAVIKVLHADAATLAQQLADIYGGEVSAVGGGPGTPRVRPPQVPGQVPQVQGGEVQRDRVRIITDGRTNSLIVLASRGKIEDIRRLVTRLDVPVTGGGRIHVYYLRNANAEELAETLNALISGQPKASTQGRAAGGVQNAAAAAAQAQAQALRAAVTELAEGVTVTADKGTNSLVIQASQEGYSTLAAVIDKLDIRRPQVLVEALIMEVGVGDGQDLGFNGLLRLVDPQPNGRGTDITVGTLTDSALNGAINNAGLAPITGGAGPLTGALANALKRTFQTDSNGNPTTEGSLIQGIIRATASLSGTNILSAPHILTTDNEEAEIKIGNNIPIISSRVQSAAGIETTTNDGINDLATSVNVERQDIGITLRVTPQITEGETLRMEILQEITDINRSLAGITGDPNQVGVPLSNRKVENTVVVKDGETVVIGGLVSDNYDDTETKVPWLGDIPIIGWAFKSTSRELRKTNLIIFLTPHIVREPEDLEKETIRKREEFAVRSLQGVDDPTIQQRLEERREHLEEIGIEVPDEKSRFPIRGVIESHERRYPLERMKEIEESQERRRSGVPPSVEVGRAAARYVVTVAVYRSESQASAKLQELLDAGYDATLVATERAGVLVYEVRVGPFATRDEAERVAAILRETQGVEPSVRALAEEE